MTYDLIDTADMNLVDSYSSLEEALISLRLTVREAGLAALATLALTPADPRQPAIQQEQLFALVQGAVRAK
jgi:hypothetical protein